MTTTAEKIEACARSAHETVRAYCDAIGDPPLHDWATCPEELRESTRNGVAGVLNGNNERSSHESWMQFRLSQGWTYGPEKSWEKRTHPNLVPFEDLPTTQRNKDGLFVAAVRTMAAALGMKVVYPAARGLPRREIDWSTGESRELT